MTTTIQKHVDDLELFQKRLELVTGAKLREVDQIDSAIAVQDKIRKKSGVWKGSKEIRKWREHR